MQQHRLPIAITIELLYSGFGTLKQVKNSGHWKSNQEPLRDLVVSIFLFSFINITIRI